MVPWRGSARYRISRSGSVSSDSAVEKPVSASTVESETLTRALAQHGVSFTLSLSPADASSPTNKPPAKASGLLVGFQLILQGSPPVTPCNLTTLQLRADLADLAFPVAGTIARGESWSDSTSNEVCVSGITGIARTRRQFIAIGDTAVGSRAAVIVQRRDSAVLSGGGVLDGRGVSLTANGLANARIYLSVPEGRVLRLEKEQLLEVVVTSSSRTKRFVQKSISVAELDR